MASLGVIAKILLLLITVSVTAFVAGCTQQSSTESTNTIQLAADTLAAQVTDVPKEQPHKPDIIPQEGLYKINLLDLDTNNSVDTVGDLAFILQHFVHIKHIDMPQYVEQPAVENKAIYRLGDHDVTFTVKAFDPADHKISKENGYVSEIDDRKFWGTDGDLPRQEISSIILQQEGKHISLADSSFNNLYEPSFGCLDNDYCYTTIYEYNKHQLLIIMNNSDGAGGYTVLLHVKDGRVVDKRVEYPF